MSELHDLIEAHRHASPEDTATALFDAIGLPQKWRMLFFAVVRDECRRQARNDVRKIEARVGQGAVDSHSLGADSRHEPCKRQEFLDARFFTGEGWVTWGEATVKDHEARIAYLTKQRNGIDVTIDHHVDAVEQITSAGVTCLADLEAGAA